MSKLADITLVRHIDRGAFTVGLTADSMMVLNDYAPELDAEKSVKLSDFSVDELEGFFKVFDYLTYQFEAGALVWRVAYNESVKTFTLTDSYIRDAVSTATLTPLVDGTPILVRFEVAGFTSNAFVEIEALYNEAFDPADVTLLEENLGIVLTGDGGMFTISNAVECRVSFRKPDASADVYLIANPFALTVIPVEPVTP